MSGLSAAACVRGAHLLHVSGEARHQERKVENKILLALLGTFRPCFDSMESWACRRGDCHAREMLFCTALSHCYLCSSGAENECTCPNMSEEVFRMDPTPPLSVPLLWHQRRAKQNLCNCLSPEQLDLHHHSALAYHRAKSWQQVQTLTWRLPAGVQGGQEPHHAGDRCGGTGSWYGTGAHRLPASHNLI